MSQPGFDPVAVPRPFTTEVSLEDGPIRIFRVRGEGGCFYFAGFYHGEVARRGAVMECAPKAEEVARLLHAQVQVIWSNLRTSA